MGKITHVIDISDEEYLLPSEYCALYHPADGTGLDPNLCQENVGSSGGVNLLTYTYEDNSPTYVGGGVYYSSVQWILGTNGFYGFGDWGEPQSDPEYSWNGDNRRYHIHTTFYGLGECVTDEGSILPGVNSQNQCEEQLGYTWNEGSIIEQWQQNGNCTIRI